MSDGETDLQDWMRENEELFKGHPGSDEYLEVVERAERASKQVESIDNRDDSRSLRLTSES